MRRITVPQRAWSSATVAANDAGEPVAISRPLRRAHAIVSALRNTSSTSALIRFTTSPGVPAGAIRPITR